MWAHLSGGARGSAQHSAHYWPSACVFGCFSPSAWSGRGLTTTSNGSTILRTWHGSGSSRDSLVMGETEQGQPRRTARWILCLALWPGLVEGCTARISSSEGGVGPLETSTGLIPTVSGQPSGCGTPLVQASPLRRLTRQEYNNTVRDLLGDTTRPADKFVAEAAQRGFTNGADSALLSPAIVEDFENSADALAKQAVADLPKLMGCTPATGAEDACAAEFIARFGARAFRRPLQADEQADYQALYSSVKAESGFATAVELVVRAFLQSPLFLYRVEFGMPAPSASAALRLSAFETASRLSYLFTGTMPDEPLRQAASEGKLQTAEQIRGQAQRLLATDNGAHALAEFHTQWGQLPGVPDLHKNDASFTPTMGRLLLEESRRFVDETLRKGDGLLQTLLTSPVTYLNADLAKYYGVSGPTGASFERFEFPAGRRTGLLTQGSFMATLAHEAQPSPVLRGKFVLEQLLCSPPPPPPNNANTTLPAVDPNKTAREQLTELTSVAPCSSCHGLLNPPGFAFEHFDALGRYRERDGSSAIDASGDLTGPGDLRGHFENHEQLLGLLSSSETVRSCVVSKWFTYTHGRGEGEADACSVSQMRDAFRKSGGNVRELLLSLTETPAFLYRTNPKGAQP